MTSRANAQKGNNIMSNKISTKKEEYVNVDGETLVVQNRWKSWVVWTSIAAQIIALFGFLGLWSKWGISVETVEKTIAAILQILVLAGVLNNGSLKNHS